MDDSLPSPEPWTRADKKWDGHLIFVFLRFLVLFDGQDEGRDNTMPSSIHQQIIVKVGCFCLGCPGCFCQAERVLSRGRYANGVYVQTRNETREKLLRLVSLSHLFSLFVNYSARDGSGGGSELLPAIVLLLLLRRLILYCCSEPFLPSFSNQVERRTLRK